MKISIADRNSNAEALANLFSSNLTPNYISHSELQGYRAIRPGEWAKNIHSLLRKEIRKQLAQPMKHFPSERNWRGIVQAHENKVLAGVALVTISQKAAVPYGTIEDIVIDRNFRGGGRGDVMMRWIADQFRRAGVKRAFLESGIGNERAHHLFERLGFRPISIVMMQDL